MPRWWPEVGSASYTIAGALTYRPGDCILEVGTERGEGSTAYLREFAQQRGAEFVTVDPDPERAQFGAVSARAEDYLEDWQHGHIRFAYLDGFDWPYSWHLSDPQAMRDYSAQYAAWGAEFSQEASAESHLAIARHLCRLGADVIVLDDTWFSPRGWQGKGGTAVPYLIGNGFYVVEHSSSTAEPTGGYVHLERP